MVLDWLAKGRTASPMTVADLMARKHYAKAVELAEGELKAKPGDHRLRIQLADALVAAGRGRDAVPYLREVADELASDGFAAKSIAILKRIQKIEPQPDVEDKLASLIEKKTRATAPSPFRPAAALPEFGMEEIGEPMDSGAAPMAADPTGAVEEPSAALATPLFPGFTKPELIAVMRGLDLVTHEPGDIVFAEGEPGDSMYLLGSGRVKAFIKDPRGRYKLVREMFEGDFFGEIALLSGKPRTATVTAATHCELLTLDRKTLDEIAVTHPGVVEVLMKFYYERQGSQDEKKIRSGEPPAS